MARAAVSSAGEKRKIDRASRAHVDRTGFLTRRRTRGARSTLSFPNGARSPSGANPETVSGALGECPSRRSHDQSERCLPDDAFQEGRQRARSGRSQRGAAESAGARSSRESGAKPLSPRSTRAQGTRPQPKAILESDAQLVGGLNLQKTCEQSHSPPAAENSSASHASNLPIPLRYILPGTLNARRRGGPGDPLADFSCAEGTRGARSTSGNSFRCARRDSLAPSSRSERETPSGEAGSAPDRGAHGARPRARAADPLASPGRNPPSSIQGAQSSWPQPRAVPVLDGRQTGLVHSQGAGG